MQIKPEFVIWGYHTDDGKVALFVADGPRTGHVEMDDHLDEIRWHEPPWFRLAQPRTFRLDVPMDGFTVILSRTFSAALRSVFGKDAKLVLRKRKKAR